MAKLFTFRPYHHRDNPVSFFCRFELKDVQEREIVLLAVLSVVAAIVSNIFLGQGSWQMFSWGLKGLSAGLLRKQPGNIWGQCLFSFLWGFLFVWIMNLWIIVSNSKISPVNSFIAICIP